MLKEIHEQPETLENALRGRFNDADATAHFGGLNLDTARLRQVERVIMTGCGTSYHAALVGEYLFEELAHLPVEVEYASEFRYRNPPIDRTIVLATPISGPVHRWLAGTLLPTSLHRSLHPLAERPGARRRIVSASTMVARGRSAEI